MLQFGKIFPLLLHKDPVKWQVFEEELLGENKNEAFLKLGKLNILSLHRRES